jgi:hypothetical protein
MRILPRRKRWLALGVLVLLLGGCTVWWLSSRQTELKRRFALVEYGMTHEQVRRLLDVPDLLSELAPGQIGDARVAIAIDDDSVALRFKDGRVVEKDYVRLNTLTDRARRLWTQAFGSAAPF